MFDNSIPANRQATNMLNVYNNSNSINGLMVGLLLLGKARGVWVLWVLESVWS